MPPRRSRVGPVLLAVVVVVAAVLRAWHLSGTTLIWDEAFTGAASRLSFGGLVSFLRGHDVHPPLDYVLRSPIAHLSTSEWLLRLPSALASLAAVALVAWWLRRRLLLAIVATALMAVGSFQLNYGWQARPYAVMALVGVVLAVLGYRWLDVGGRRLAVVAGLVLLVGCFESESGLLLAAGLFLLPGVRRDADAWWWRGAIAAAGVIWLAAWGTVLVDQLPNVGGQAPVPLTTVHGFFSTVNELIDTTPAVMPLALLLVLAGGLCLARDDRPLARVWVCGFVVPVLLTAVLGVRMHLLWPKTLAFASWGPMLGLAGIVDAAVRRWRPLGLAAAAAVAVVVLPSSAHAVSQPQVGPPAWGPEVAALERVVRPGDAVIGPSWLTRPVEWYFGTQPALDSPGSQIAILPYVFVPRAGPPTGRVWIVAGATQPFPALGRQPCRPTRSFPDGSELRCLQGAG